MHKGLAVGVEQPGPLTAQRFADQEACLAAIVKGSGVNLYILGVDDASPSKIGHCQAVAGSAARVRGVQKYLPQPPTGQNGLSLIHI